jgi:hypothetical protein
MDQASNFRWRSLACSEKNQRFQGLDPQPRLATMGVEDTVSSWREDGKILQERFGDAQVKEERKALAEGWAVGSTEWEASL